MVNDTIPPSISLPGVPPLSSKLTALATAVGVLDAAQPSYAAKILTALADQLTPTAAQAVTTDVWTTALHQAGRTVLATVPALVRREVCDRAVAALPSPRIAAGETCGEWAIRLRAAARTI